MSIKVLPTFKKEVEESVIKIAEELYALAKAGEITSIAAVVVQPDGESLTKVSATLARRSLIGAVALLLHDMLHG